MTVSFLKRFFCCPLVFALCLTTACGGYRYQFTTGQPRSEPERVVSETRHLAFWGWMSAKPFDLAKACPEGVAEFGSRVSFVNWLPAFVTFGLYTPRTVYAVCAKQKGES